ncbi:type 1 glutamine amidotransferase [Jannaschia donghaensis]|uniref:GMP synthase [glutamine-hydrolyzing] n=1 Tax=Jannaschia donghaensis TaxID=420998 RepID=A0A0M6YER0_9RHOB|nr:type 1 glutamine amidotransferase [Jannaschia donghaensis]CTQ48424.1 GMP synthase [glutamine-hydrolyzing] [Jannaschia donghaensis]
MKIGILQAGHTPPELRPSRGDFDTMFAQLLDGYGFEFEAYDVENMVFPDGVDECDGWLITGSKHGAYEKHAFIAPLERFIRDAYAADVPMVGVCFGHQIIAQALGGSVVKFDGGWAIGRRDYVLPGGQTVALNAWHQDQVVQRPEGAACTGSNAFCENAILTYGRRAFTVQPHPEFSTDLIRDYVASRRGTGTYPEDLMAQAEADAATPVDNDRIAAAMARFFLTRFADVDA